MTSQVKKVKAYAVLDSGGGNYLVPTPETKQAFWGPYRVYPTLRAAKRERYMPNQKIVPCTITYSLPAKSKKK